MKLAELLRVYPVRARNLMWFLGAGASAGARVPTATDLMWAFKRTIYCSEQKVSPKALEDLSDENNQRRIQAYLNATNRFPSPGDTDEYAALFEYAYPDPKDRRTRLDALLSGAQPSYGHSVLAALMKLGLARAVWTTNFDRAIEDAAHAAFGTSSKLTVATIDSGPTALRALNDGSYPLLVKLHGDFQSERLKNTKAEMRDQEAELRRALCEGCRRFGLIVAGYSGRDHSIMDALEEAARMLGAFPAGLFWMVRSEGVVFDRVERLIETARAAGIDAHLVEVETFDELLGDLFTQVPDIPDDVAAQVIKRVERFSYAPMPDAAGTYPAIRLNALPVTVLPTVCRLVECTIGNAKDVQEAIRAAGERVIATRRQIGVIGFGGDAAMRRTFDPHNITKFDLHQIEFKRLAFDSAEFSIVSAALACALTRERGIRSARRHSGFRLTPEADDDASFSRIKKLMNVVGVVPGTSIRCRPALDIRLDVRFDAAWLLMEPSIMFDDSAAVADVEKARDYVREHLARLYNREQSDLLDAWIEKFFGSENELRVSALGIADGLDAAFTLTRTTAFTWRQK
jgi:NAD-dependent SIR2 family protein deacetylase